MNTIFIIGGIGSGKSTVTRYFKEHGVPTLDLDLVGHKVLALGRVKIPLIEAFGEEIIGAKGIIDRKVLASKAFASPEATSILANITAPFIAEEMKSWVAKHSEGEHPFVIVEVSAFDGPQGYYGQLASSIIAVTAPIKTRIARAANNGFDEVDICRRIARQPTDAERRLWAQYVIENDGSLEELTEKLDALWEELKQ